MYDRADRLTAIGATAVTVDAAGNLTAKGPDTFAFDAANRMTSATVAGTTETYAFDGDGTRVSRRVGTGPVTRYVSDVNGPLPLVLDDGTRSYVWGQGLAYAVPAGGIEVYHADRLGSVRDLTDASGAVTATYRTDEWGIRTQATGSSSQPFGYTGEPRDGTGLTYLRSRSYDPGTGRFTSRDTWPGSIADPQTLNRYAYVTNSPATRSDPSGHCGVDVVVDAAFIVFDLGSLVFGPPKDREGNLLALGADIGGAAIPCATGLGVIARGSVKWAVTSEDVLAHFWRIAKHVDTRTLEAARLELQGIVVRINPATGRSFDHVQEIVDAQNGLISVIADARRSLSDPGLSVGERSQVESVLSQASSMLDWTEQYVPR